MILLAALALLLNTPTMCEYDRLTKTYWYVGADSDWGYGSTCTQALLMWMKKEPILTKRVTMTNYPTNAAREAMNRTIVTESVAKRNAVPTGNYYRATLVESLGDLKALRFATDQLAEAYFTAKYGNRLKEIVRQDEEIIWKNDKKRT